jgi:hypothetical protein
LNVVEVTAASVELIAATGISLEGDSGELDKLTDVIDTFDPTSTS